MSNSNSINLRYNKGKSINYKKNFIKLNVKTRKKKLLCS